MNIDLNGKSVEVNVTPNDEEFRKRALMKRIASILDSSCFALMLAAYIVISLVVKATSPSGLDAWAVYWTLLILGGIPGSIVRAISKKKFCEFPIWSFALFAYLFIGMYASLWHPYWVILLAMPVYYSIFGPIDNLLDDKRHGRI